MHSIENLNTRNIKLNALIVYAHVWNLNPDIIQNYSDDVEKLGAAINANLKTQQQNKKQKENWMSKEELVEFANNQIYAKNDDDWFIEVQGKKKKTINRRTNGEVVREQWQSLFGICWIQDNDEEPLSKS